MRGHHVQEGRSLLRIAVTGASSGIGKETARALATAGHDVILICRDQEGGGPAHDAVSASACAAANGGSATLETADLSVQADIRKLADRLMTRHETLDVLVNNAGTLARGRRRETVDGIELQLAVNHLAPFLLTNLLLPLLEAAPTARVVNVSSDAHRMVRHIDLDDLQVERRRYGGFRRYCETKGMGILFTRELAKRLQGTALTANCLHPGAVSSNLGNPPAFLRPFTRLLFSSPEQGARGTVFLATSAAVEGVSGEYFAGSRRIVPSPAASDERAAATLWKLSEELTAIGP